MTRISFSDTVKGEERDDILVVTIDNPPVNATSASVRAGLLAALAHSYDRAHLAGIVLTSAGTTFIGGADIREFGLPPVEPILPDVIEAIEAHDKPVVAALNGAALGGGLEVALACHARLALSSAVVALPEVKLGLVPDWASLLTLPRRIGHARAQQLLARSGSLTGAQAQELGLVDVLAAEDGAVMAAAVAEAAALAQLPREAYARMKRMLQPTAEEFDRVLQSEEDAQAALLQGPAFREGYAAMRDKRAADFIGSGA